MGKSVEILQEYIDSSKKICFFGGAGVSTESGIPDFRSAKGLYTLNKSAEEILSSTFFYSHPDLFYDFYREHMMYLDAKPNITHKYLADLEKYKDVTIITQNIDGLHQLAGSSKVYELHGTIHQNYCLKCHKFYDAKYIKESKGLPRCTCGSLIKPKVTLYEEALDENVIIKTIQALEEADLLIVGGTSLKVYPAASFISYFRGTKKVYIDLKDNKLPNYLYIQDKLGNVFSKLKLPNQ